MNTAELIKARGKGWLTTEANQYVCDTHRPEVMRWHRMSDWSWGKLTESEGRATFVPFYGTTSNQARPSASVARPR